MSRPKDGDPIDTQFKIVPGAVFEFPASSNPYLQLRAADSVMRDALRELHQQFIPPGQYVSQLLRSTAYHMSLETRIRAKIEKNGFFGKLGQEKAVVIDPQPDYLPESFRDLDPERIRSFIGTVDLISTGRGTIGSYVYGVSVGLRGLNRYNEYDFRVGLREMSGQAISDLISGSQTNWARLLSEGLRSPYRGGIPGLGKR